MTDKKIPAPYGWPASVKFDPDACAKENLFIPNLSMTGRYILGHFKEHNHTRQLTYKGIVERALEEFLEAHKDEFSDKG